MARGPEYEISTATNPATIADSEKSWRSDGSSPTGFEDDVGCVMGDDPVTEKSFQRRALAEGHHGRKGEPAYFNQRNLDNPWSGSEP
ncbi:hypothetical protein HCU01_08050 [Halomonas cupida]|uniref:Uncharacterized protein n=1 Tax=Halomonas cupida TaxID=44933 RepID=A0ABQ0WBA3_9GAMM|nr:hypothetical protein HCU01_08050 [Halomonas cupida]